MWTKRQGEEFFTLQRDRGFAKEAQVQTLHRSEVIEINRQRNIINILVKLKQK